MSKAIKGRGIGEYHYSQREIMYLTGIDRKKAERIFIEASKLKEVNVSTLVYLDKLKPYFPSLNLYDLHENVKKLNVMVAARVRILNDPANVKVGGFCAKYSLLNRMLDEPTRKWFDERFAAMRTNRAHKHIVSTSPRP